MHCTPGVDRGFLTVTWAHSNMHAERPSLARIPVTRSLELKGIGPSLPEIYPFVFLVPTLEGISVKQTSANVPTKKANE